MTEARGLWIVQNIEGRIDGDAANRNTIRGRTPGDHFCAHALVGNSE